MRAGATDPQGNIRPSQFRGGGLINGTSLRVLILEEQPAAARLMLHELRRAGFDPDCHLVQTEADYLAHLEPMPHLILAGHLPQFGAVRALMWLQERGLETPFILVTGRLLAHLGRAVARVLKQDGLGSGTHRAEGALQARHPEVRVRARHLWKTATLATVGKLAGGMVHELSNPLTTVSLRVEELLAQVPASDAKHVGLKVIKEEVQRMAKLVGTMRHFSRKPGSDISMLDVRTELERSLDLLDHHLRRRRITVVRQFTPDVPMVQANGQHLWQLFLNLLTDASDAIEDGGTVTIRGAAAHVDNSPHVVIEVANTCVGNAQEEWPTALQPCSARTVENDDRGLVLSICRRIVEEYHGTLDVISEAGNGATVRILLPVTRRACRLV
jgi:signal transduction histidine kinase